MKTPHDMDALCRSAATTTRACSLFEPVVRLARPSLLVLLLLAVSLAMQEQQVRAQDALTGSTLDGIFSAAQADRGEESFVSQCTECHELAEFVGPDAFFVSEVGKPLWPIFDFMWSEMPEDRPAWLDPEEYADILSYLLREFGMPAGTAEFPADPQFIKTIQLDEPVATGG
jgi:hypothetical protein